MDAPAHVLDSPAAKSREAATYSPASCVSLVLPAVLARLYGRLLLERAAQGAGSAVVVIQLRWGQEKVSPSVR